MVGTCIAAALVAVALGVSTVRADVAPPPGYKQNSFGIRVENISSFPDYVVLVFHWGTSNGAPMMQIGEVRPGAVLGFGRRLTGPPELYAMRRNEFETWRASNPSAGGYPSDEQEQAMQALFASDRVIRCGVRISPIHTVPTSGPDEVVHVFRAEAISEGSCRITPVELYQPEEPVDGSRGRGSAGCPGRR